MCRDLQGPKIDVDGSIKLDLLGNGFIVAFSCAMGRRRQATAAFELRQELGSLPASCSNWLVSRQSSTLTLLLFTQTCCSVRYAFINIYRRFYCSPVSSSLNGGLVRRNKQLVSEFIGELLQSELVTEFKPMNLLHINNQVVSSRTTFYIGS